MNILEARLIIENLDQKANLASQIKTFYGRFGILFQSFHNLLQRIKDAKEEKQINKINYLLFGNDGESLSALLKKLSEDTGKENKDKEMFFNPVMKYLTALCSEWLLEQIKPLNPYYENNKIRIKETKKQIIELQTNALHHIKFKEDFDHKKYIKWFRENFFRNTVKR